MKLKSILSKITFTIACSSILSFSAFAQEQGSLRDRANKYYNLGEYAKANSIYERLVDSKKTKESDIQRIAKGYLIINRYEEAENWYARLWSTGKMTTEDYYDYAEVLKLQGKYAEAKQQFLKYESQSDKTLDVSVQIAGCDSAALWMAHPTIHQIKNEAAVNTGYADFGAFPYAKGVYYTSEPATITGAKAGMTGNAYLKLYSAEVDQDGISLKYPNVVIGELNSSEYHIGPIISNQRGDQLYVTRTYVGKDLERYQRGGLNIRKHNLELIIYTKNGDSWIPEPFKYNDVSKFSVGHAALSDDEQVLYYASNREGGLGGVDIWYSELQADGTWGEPKNAGSEINSAADEMFPSVFGNMLYYSSNGFAGMGGLDIFKAEGAKSNFKGRENLKYPINSAADDFSFIIVNQLDEANSSGYLSSNRPGGMGSDDIYSFNYKKPKIKIIIEGLVIDKKTLAPINDARVSLFDLNNAIIARKLASTAGEFSFQIDPGVAFAILAEQKGYHSDSLRMDGIYALRDTVVHVKLALEPIYTVGDKFVLENIYYDFDKHNIRPDAAKILNQLVATLRDNPTLKIELSSHTDSRGSDNYNLKLSQRRAQSAVDYLVSRGIDRNRVVAKGYGETRLVNKCKNGVACSIAEHQLNRRTEVEVLSY